MQARKYVPGAPLSQFVHCLWFWEGAPRTHAMERLLPNGEFSIIFNLLDEPIRIYDIDNLNRFRSYGTAALSGARSNCFAIETSQQERVIGIQFKAGGAFPFLGMPASEVEDASVDLNDIWPGHVVEIQERLLSAPSVDCMLATLERCLLDRLARPLELHPAVAYAVQQFQRAAEGSKVSEVCGRIGLSSRRLIELFRREVGLTPKVFSRVRRFQHVLETVRLGKRVDWPRVALDCGYYDQAHFIHEFQAFSGLTPSEYVAAATPNINHVRLT
jgi:AraC-like DNA-binding protein